QFDDRRILLATQEGLIKLVQLKEFLPSRTLRSYGAIPASVDNPLVAVDLVAEYDTAVICASRNGYVLKYRLEEVPVLSLGARGVKAINLRDDALVGACAVTDITKDEVLFLINRGTLKREFVANIETSHRPAKGKMFLKSVKTNPYQFVGMVSANVFRLKEHLLLRIITDKNVVTFTGIDLPVDKFEHGVPLLDKEFVPLRLLFDEQDKEAIDDIQKKLAKERRKDLPEASETENVPPPEPTEVETDDVMDALEKIININASEDDPDGEKVIQQTLF
ncbi:MAG TPA: DNA gyrase C-terminal beta-propeller domain-containing protein, partial [Bacillota bacterium]|nr:DNA gyrase C-terminal beta-propeller domain-containing protein [Bacillota bacterium]